MYVFSTTAETISKPLDFNMKNNNNKKQRKRLDFMCILQQ